MIRANIIHTTVKSYKPQIILSLFVLIFIMFFTTFFIIIIKNNVSIAKTRVIRELKENNKKLDTTLKEKIYSFKRLSASEVIRTKAIAYNMTTPKNQYNIVYVNDSKKKKTRRFKNVFASISSMFNINEQTSAKDDIQ